MWTLEKQRALKKEIKKRPEVKKLFRLTLFFNIIGFLTFFILIGFIFIKIGEIYSRKYKLLIEQSLMEEIISQKSSSNENINNTTNTQNEEKQEDNLFQLLPTKSQETPSKETVEDRRAKADKLVAMQKKDNFMSIILFLIISAIWVILFLFPLGKILGVEEWNICIFDMLSDLIKEDKESILYAFLMEDIHLLSFIMFILAGVMCIGIVAFSIFQYKTNTTDEQKIRNAIMHPERQEAMLNVSIDARSNTFLFYGFSFIIIILFIGIVALMLWLPIKFLIYMGDFIEISKLTFFLVAIGIIAIIAIWVGIIALDRKEKEDRQLLGEILSAKNYNRNRF